MNPGTLIALNEADATLAFSDEIMAQLKSCWQADVGPGTSCDFTMSPRHASELHQYLEAHRAKMNQWREKVKVSVEKGEDAPGPSINLLASYRFDLDAAMRFVSEAFIKPRRSAGAARVLEAADWMCVEGFRVFLDHARVAADQHPVGPIVALDSQRSPAIWRDDGELRIPSLFAEAIPVRDAGGDLARMLPAFPVICLPSDLAELPEYYVLLSHEVGHAVDNELELSAAILGELPPSPHRGYWKAWMREIVADAVGVALSGAAFPVALWRFAQRRALDRKLSESNIYPPMELRLMFLRSALALFGEPNHREKEGIPSDEVLANLPNLARELKADFESSVMPVIQRRIFAAVPGWRGNEEAISRAVNLLRGNRSPEVSGLKFRLVPSVITLAIKDEGASRIRARFKSWHEDYRNKARPDWIGSQSNWTFTEHDLPSLRATLVGPDGITKYPPETLLTAHRRISFIGSTNKWLLKAVKEAMSARKNAPWEQIDVFFASDRLLAQVERYDEADSKWEIEKLKEERDQQIKCLAAYFRANSAMIKSWTFRMFDGPPLFASFWDGKERGGRIHVSSQLLGIDIGKCPSTDHLWLRDEPTSTYQAYLRHLGILEKTAKQIHL